MVSEPTLGGRACLSSHAPCLPPGSSVIPGSLISVSKRFPGKVCRSPLCHAHLAIGQTDLGVELDESE